MSVRKTISDSKGIFHKEFPYVIPSVYRRVVDEYLVELNLLTNQSNFKVDGFFAYGLTVSFDTFTQGYKPESHKIEIFNALCKACNIETSAIKAFEKSMQKFCEGESVDTFISKINLNKNESVEGISVNQFINKNNYYSRIHAIGIYELINLGKLKEIKGIEKVDQTNQIALEIGFTKERVTKDLSQYKNNQDKIKETMELIKVTAEETKRRMEEKK